MKRIELLLIFLAITMFIAGCTGANTNSQTEVGKLILNKGQINTIKILKGATVQTTIPITDSTVIADLLRKVQKIPVNRLSKNDDNGFMRPRILDESTLNISLYTNDDQLDSMAGMFCIWPDGFLYVVDVESMKGNERTVSYLSESKYAETYKWLNDKIGQNVP